MTALIYKAALPTYTSAEALIADAGETLFLNDPGKAYELLPAGSGDSIPGTARWFTGAEARASRGRFTIAANPDIASAASGPNIFPAFDTLVGPAELYEIAPAPENAWGPNVPYIKTAGIYRVEAVNSWGANSSGTRFMALEFWDEPFVGPFLNRTASFPPTGWNPIIADQITVCEDTKPLAIGLTLVQTSGASLSVNGITLTVFKLAEFL